MIFGYKPAQLRKLGVALLGFILTVVSVALEGNLIPASWLPYVVAFIGVCSSYGVFKVRNVSRQAVAYSSDTLPPASESGTV